MSARPKARHVTAVDPGECGARGMAGLHSVYCVLTKGHRGRCNFRPVLRPVPAPQEKGAEEPGGCPTCGLDCKGHETRTSADCAAMVTYGITPRRCTKRATVGPLCSQHAKAPATVPLPLSLVERAASVIEGAAAELRCDPLNDEMGKNAESEFQWGHWCTHCDEYADRNGEVRAALRSVLAELRTYVGEGGKA